MADQGLSRKCKDIQYGGVELFMFFLFNLFPSLFAPHFNLR